MKPIHNYQLSKETILNDYRIACESRETSILGRKEIFLGKAKFGIFGDGKELAQLAMAHVFQKGDFRAGYYRDQTFMMAIDALTPQQFFAQLYAHADVIEEPASAGRMMNSHFATRMLKENGQWLPLTALKNSTADLSPTGSQIPRLLGLAYASKLFRNNPALQQFKQFSHQGNEVAFGTIGNAATSEGMFFEAINAAGVLQVPMLLSIWDDGYGISVPQNYHTTKGSISKAMAGFQKTSTQKGIEILTVKGWDYIGLYATYQKAIDLCRHQHIPVLIHVEDLTQPQGHSTSGSHERYKSTERLDWEKKYDCIAKMRLWLLEENIATNAVLEKIEQKAQEKIKLHKNAAWEALNSVMQVERKKATSFLQKTAAQLPLEQSIHLSNIAQKLNKNSHPAIYQSISAVRQALHKLTKKNSSTKKVLIQWIQQALKENHQRLSSHLYSQSTEAALRVPIIPPIIPHDAPFVDGRMLLNNCFDAIFKRDPRVFAIGQDIGKLGDVNQGFAGLQKKYGELCITDTGIRECTIIGQGIGAAMRGLRPIAEIQYLDYLLYALQILSDDLATLHYRTKGGQKAPLIIRTRGHRLEGIWHSGSYLAGILHNVQGIYVLVPRNMTQAVGFYNTMLQADDPALIIECLNGYRLKEQKPSNLTTFTVPLGVPSILHLGMDVTIVTYGAMCQIVLEAVKILEDVGITCDVIDLQSLFPFDIHHRIVQSLKKTNRILFIDEDVPGGTTAYMMQKVLEEQGGYNYLDESPITLTSQPHRPAYGDNGNYFSKPNVDDVFEKVYSLVHPDDNISIN